MSDRPSAISGAFNRPFTEQVAFFRNKLGNQVPTQAWDDIVRAEHDSAFMVAGAAKAELLSDLAAAVDKAIAEGRGLEEFRADFRDIVRRNGWTGFTGEGSVKGEAWRVRTILTTNAMTSYAAGRLAQLRAGNFPFWVYRHGGSEEPRPQHLSWDGLVLPPDHEFWMTHYPPSDWGCSCYVLGARSERAAKRLGGKPGKSLPEGWNTIDPKTGAPVGIGKNWNYPPGDTVTDTIRALSAKVGAWDYQIAKGFMDTLPAAQADALARSYRALPSTAADTRRYAQRIYEPKPDLADLPPLRTLGRLTTQQADQIEELVNRPVQGFDFSIDQSAIKHVVRRHTSGKAELSRGQRSVTAADFAFLPEILEFPDQVTRAGQSKLGEETVDYIRVINGESYLVRMVVRGKLRKTVALKSFFIKVSAE